MEGVPVCVWVYLGAGTLLTAYQMWHDWSELTKPEGLPPAIDAAILVVTAVLCILIWPAMPWIEDAKE